MASRFKKSRRPRYKRRGRRRKLSSTAAGPWIKFLIIFVVIAGALFATYKFALPPVLKILNIEWPPSTPEPPTPTPSPSPTPNLLFTLEATEIQREIEFDREQGSSEIRFVADPMRYGNNIIFTGGYDPEGGQRNNAIYIYDMNSKERRAQSGLTRENDDYFQPQMNDKWIVYLDHKRAGGGFIRAFDRNNGDSFIIKEYYVGQPLVTLSGDRVCWIERTGSYMDKVFLFDLVSQENVCLETLERSVFGQSSCHMSEKEIVWAGYDASDNSTDKDAINGAIYSYAFGSESTAVGTYEPNTYVHNPKTNGDIRAWIDTNGGPDAQLFISVKGGQKIFIAKGVTGFGIGSNFVAYCDDERRMHVYVLDVPDNQNDKIISIAGEKCIFSGVSGDAVFWFVTGVSQNDILKYATVNELGNTQQGQITPNPNEETSPSPTPNETTGSAAGE